MRFMFCDLHIYLKKTFRLGGLNMQFKIVLKPIDTKCLHTEEAVLPISMQIYVMSPHTIQFILFPFE